MRILYLTQYFPPEIGATQTRGFEMARGLVRCGHRVTVLTEFPNHPAGVIPGRYRGRWIERDSLDGIDVVRVRVRASTAKGFLPRMLFYCSYAAMATVVGLFRLRDRPDLVYATSPPLFVGLAALALGALRRRPMVFEVRDLWPESAEQLGEVRNRAALALSRALERACYRRARRIVVVTRGIRDRLLARGVPEARLALVPNGVNTDLYRPLPREAARRAGWGIPPAAFVVAYTGLHGLAHGLETLLDAAELLRDEPDLVFLLVGDGPRKGAIRARAAARGLANVHFRDAVPEGELPGLLAEVDVGVDVRRRLAITRGTLPVKLFSYLACGVPAVLAIEGEAETLVREADAGLVVPPERPDLLAEAIRSLRADPDRRRRLGENGRRLVTSGWSRDRQARDLARILEGVAER